MTQQNSTQELIEREIQDLKSEGFDIQRPNFTEGSEKQIDYAYSLFLDLLIQALRDINKDGLDFFRVAVLNKSINRVARSSDAKKIINAFKNRQSTSELLEKTRLEEKYREADDLDEDYLDREVDEETHKKDAQEFVKDE